MPYFISVDRYRLDVTETSKQKESQRWRQLVSFGASHGNRENPKTKPPEVCPQTRQAARAAHYNGPGIELNRIVKRWEWNQS